MDAYSIKIDLYLISLFFRKMNQGLIPLIIDYECNYVFGGLYLLLSYFLGLSQISGGISSLPVRGLFLFPFSSDFVFVNCIIAPRKKIVNKYFENL